MRKHVVVPIFRTELMLSVSESVRDERLRFEGIFGIYMLGSDVKALCSSAHNKFALFFHKDSLTHGMLAHEIFHVTHRMLDYVGGKFDMNNQEQHAYLCEWLTDWVYKTLRQENIEIQ